MPKANIKLCYSASDSSVHETIEAAEKHEAVLDMKRILASCENIFLANYQVDALAEHIIAEMERVAAAEEKEEKQQELPL